MTTIIIATLSTYGFEIRRADLFYGVGSLVWGHTASVKALGADLYEVTIAHWAYDEWGDPLEDTRETRVLHGGQALGWVFAEVPASFWRRR